MITPKKMETPNIKQEAVMDVSKQDLNLNEVKRKIGSENNIQMRF
tara:strand:+ start:307 stop:441 length:135 start_codon:yes stop_codon:yes gene_type:complete